MSHNSKMQYNHPLLLSCLCSTRKSIEQSIQMFRRRRIISEYNFKLIFERTFLITNSPLSKFNKHFMMKIYRMYDGLARFGDFTMLSDTDSLDRFIYILDSLCMQPAYSHKNKGLWPKFWIQICYRHIPYFETASFILSRHARQARIYLISRNV